MRVVIVNTFDTEAVLQDFLQTVRAWDAGRPHVPITLRVDTPQLSPCPCEQGAYDVPAARPVSRGRAAEHRPGRGPVSKAQWYLAEGVIFSATCLLPGARLGSVGRAEHRYTGTGDPR